MRLERSAGHIAIKGSGIIISHYTISSTANFHGDKWQTYVPLHGTPCTG